MLQCRSLFQLFQTLSYETLGFQHVEKAQQALLSNPRAVTPHFYPQEWCKTIVCHANARVHFSVVLQFSSKGCSQTQKWRSHPLRRSLVFVLGSLGARHIFEVCNPSYLRMQFLRCSLWMCCWRFYFSLPALIYNSSNTRLQFLTINHTRCSYFSRARDFTTQCLCHPSHSNSLFSFATIVLAPEWASRAGGVKQVNVVVPAIVAVHILLLFLPLFPLTLLFFQPL